MLPECCSHGTAKCSRRHKIAFAPAPISKPLATSFRTHEKEYKEASKADSGTGIQLIPDESNIYAWKAIIQGPDDTPFAGGRFELTIRVPEQYPLVPPTVSFRTKIFHPNVHFKTGEICLDILKNAWSPAWTLQSVCQAVIALMHDPAPDSPLNCDAGNLLRAGDILGYTSLAQMYTVDMAC